MFFDNANRHENRCSIPIQGLKLLLVHFTHLKDLAPG
jgi:hypothetical protein